MRKPAIVIGKADPDRLIRLADSLTESRPELADVLLGELERARVVEAAPAGSVQMGSTLEYEAEGVLRRVTLVYPGEADLAEGKVSILTPIGTALIGLRAGQSIGWTANDGRVHRLTVVSVG